MLYLFTYTNTPGSAELREKFGPDHRAFRAGLGDKLKTAGPRFDGDEGPPTGSMVILEADSMEEANKIVASDPFLIEGVFTLDSSSRIDPRSWLSIEIS